MSNISNIGATTRLEAYSGSGTLTRSQPQVSNATLDRTDSVELSDQARALATQPTPIREDLVASVRDQIARGVYENDTKLDAAITELAKDLAPQQ